MYEYHQIFQLFKIYVQYLIVSAPASASVSPSLSVCVILSVCLSLSVCLCVCVLILSLFAGLGVILDCQKKKKVNNLDYERNSKTGL